MSSLTDSSAWHELIRHRRAMAEITMRTLFAEDPNRFPRFTAEAAASSSTTPRTASPTRP